MLRCARGIAKVSSLKSGLDETADVDNTVKDDHAADWVAERVGHLPDQKYLADAAV